MKEWDKSLFSFKTESAYGKAYALSVAEVSAQRASTTTPHENNLSFYHPVASRLPIE